MSLESTPKTKNSGNESKFCKFESDLSNITNELTLDFKGFKTTLTNEQEFTSKNIMTDTDSIMKRLFTSLKTPDIIRELEEFRGDICQLHQFIGNVNDIIILCAEVLPKEQDIPVTFIKAIRGKIKGEANRMLVSNDVSSTDWEEIRTALITHYSDPRSEVALIRDLHKTRQGSQTSKQFHAKIVEIQTALVAHANLHGSDDAKKNLYKEMCLAQFIANLREPLGSNIRSRDPETLAEALEICLGEENMYYIKYEPPQRNFRQYRNQEYRNKFPYKQEIKPSVKFKELEDKPKEPQPGSSQQWKPSFRTNPSKQTYQQTKFPAIKQERNMNITETEEESNDTHDEENDSTEEESHDEFFHDEASDNE